MIEYEAKRYTFKDELFMFTASVKLPGEKFASGKEQSGGPSEVETKTVVLNSADELFAELRDKNFSAVGTVVSRKAKALSKEFSVR